VTDSRTRRRLAVLATQLALVTVVLTAWTLVSMSSSYWEFVLSSPSKVAVQLWEWAQDGTRWLDVRTTLTEAVLGYLLGALAAIVVVSALAPSEWLQRLTIPFISLLQAIPFVVLAPLFIVWFGIGLRSKVYFVAALCFFLVFVGLFEGLRSVDRIYVNSVKTLGGGPFELIRHVYVPAVFAWFMASLRLASQLALLAACVAEYLGSQQGIGFLISSGQSTLNSTRVLSGVLVIACVAVIIDRVLFRIERRFSSWRLF
jgi:NitT/TauT family transport system permease protein